ncbi:signal-transducing adaptor protein 2 isoform X1 [Herpailurus yagouaroundi]|uniref:signal-transducing adaptor protein 2 isoform X1 n=1 Tax=Herpailurus yagouaroundi TaxID=1608482 RepID=UPI001AD740E6|nr:signal-transducing adaptor protein 2 isoform X1 [Puma yagouaroundi]
MASALSPPRVPKPKGALPSHYYENFLEKKGPCDRDYKKFWAGLKGCTLYFYNSNRDSQHVEKLDLAALVKLTDDPPWGSSRDPGIHFSLALRNQEIKFKVESLESREMWKGFILTVVELRIPSNLTLLPGHLYMMAEALAKEEARRALEVPSCFLKVSRLEAQLLLERYPECGNLLLRPSGDGTGGVSVTTRQTLDGSSVVRHYKVKHEGPKYVIDVEEPFSCDSLDAVVNYFVTRTKKSLVPFLPDEDYEKVLGYMEADNENGESVWVAREAPASQGPGPAPPSGGPRQLPPVPVTPVSSPNKLTPLPNEDENYVIPIAHTPAATYVNGDVPSPSRPVIRKPKKVAKVQAKPPKLPKPPVAPKPEPQGLNGGLAKKLAGNSAQAFFPTTGLADLTAELEEKLRRRRALEHSARHTGDL